MGFRSGFLVFFLSIVLGLTSGDSAADVYQDGVVARKINRPTRMHYLKLSKQLRDIRNVTKNDRDGIARQMVIDYLIEQIALIDTQFSLLHEEPNFNNFIDVFEVENEVEASNALKLIRDKLIEYQLKPDLEYIEYADYEEIVVYVKKFQHYDMLTEIEGYFYGQSRRPNFVNTLIAKFQGKLIELEQVMTGLEQRIDARAEKQHTKAGAKLTELIRKTYSHSKVFGLTVLTIVSIILDDCEKVGVRIPISELKSYLEAVGTNPKNLYKHPLLRGKHIGIKVTARLIQLVRIPAVIIQHLSQLAHREPKKQTVKQG